MVQCPCVCKRVALHVGFSRQVLAPRGSSASPHLENKSPEIKQAHTRNLVVLSRTLAGVPCVPLAFAQPLQRAFCSTGLAAPS